MPDCLSHVLFFAWRPSIVMKLSMFTCTRAGVCHSGLQPVVCTNRVVSSNGDVLLDVDPQGIAAVLTCINSIQSNADPWFCSFLSLSFRLAVSTCASDIVSPDMKAAEHVQHAAMTDALLRYGSRCRRPRSLKPAMCHRCSGG